MKKGLLIAGMILSTAMLFAQKNFSLYQMKGIPQAINVNPAFMPKAKMYFSLPIGMINVGVSNSAFSFNDLFTKRADDSLAVNSDNIIGKLKDRNILSFDMQQEVFGFGVKLNESWFSFSAVNRLKFNFLYPGDLIKLGIQGNGAFLNERASFDDLGINLSSYMEYNLGYARKIGDMFQVGGRLKLLSGIANINTRKTKLGLFTDPETFALTIDGSAEVNTANIDPFFSDSSFSANSLASSAFNFSNMGIGLDLGGTWKMNEKVTLSLSAVDLGSITWKTNTKNFIVNDINYTFDGVDLNRYFSDSSDVIMDELSDTLEKIFQHEENTQLYRTGLNSKFYIGASYEFTKSFSASALIFSEVIKTKYVPGLTLSGNAVIKDWLVATVNYTMYNNTFANLGLGLSLRGGPIQFYVMTDNVLGFINPLATKSLHLCGGMSILIRDKGEKTKEKKKKDVEGEK